MRTALLADIHGNREALSACLAHLNRHPVDRLMFLGDIVGYGAEPVWCLETVMSRVQQGAIALLGNHDEAVFKSGGDMNAAAQAAIDWTRQQMSVEHCDFLENMPVLVEEGDVLFVHASAASPRSWQYVTGPRDADTSLQYTSKRITICGHVHHPRFFHAMDRRPVEVFTPPAGTPIPLLRQRRWVTVLGSVGQPRDGNPAACYAVFDSAQCTLTLYRVPYDVDAAARKIRAAGLPARLADRLYTGT